MQDFLRARQNGFLALAANLGFDPTFRPDLPGSQPLTVLNTFGQLGNNNVRTAIQQGELARLADLYMTTGSQTAAARAAFMPNPGIYAAEYVLNGSYQDYDALQLELRGRIGHAYRGRDARCGNTCRIRVRRIDRLQPHYQCVDARAAAFHCRLHRWPSESVPIGANVVVHWRRRSGAEDGYVAGHTHKPVEWIRSFDDLSPLAVGR
jgi:hypothetical protein